MKKATNVKLLNRFLFLSLFAFLISCVVLLSFDYSIMHDAKDGAVSLVKGFSNAFNKPKPYPISNNISFSFSTHVNSNSTQKINSSTPKEELDRCSGRYIYVHNLPSRFNDEVIKDCKTLVKWLDMCPSVQNYGFGPLINDKQEAILSNKSWYSTNQFLLDVIFRERMKQYDCLTKNSSLASAIFVPFYAGLDVGRHLWGFNTSVRDSLAQSLLHWLRQQNEWKKMWGRDHFIVSGRIAWDFRRITDNDSDWGSKLMFMPECMNLTMLAIESTSWSNEIAIPYPSYFHPSSDGEVYQWQKQVGSHERKYLFTFAGAPRPNWGESIRAQIINQCVASNQTCKLLDCLSWGKGNLGVCDNPFEVMKVFIDSDFCLHPSGDSFTRRSTFDSILAGCIPVFFHPYSAYAQYIWYFPKNYTTYSVYIPESLVREGKVNIKDTLLRISKDQIKALRKEVLKLIPKVTYADPKRSRMEKLEDAFDIAVRNVVERVEKLRKEIREGKDPGVGFAVENSWRLKLNGTVGKHPLEQFF